MYEYNHGESMLIISIYLAFCLAMLAQETFNMVNNKSFSLTELKTLAIVILFWPILLLYIAYESGEKNGNRRKR